jgi:hypothetical protein
MAAEKTQWWKSDGGVTTDKQLGWLRDDNGTAATNSKQYSTKPQDLMSNDGTDDKDNKTTINKYLAAEAEDNEGLQEAGGSGGYRGGTCHVHFYMLNSLGGNLTSIVIIHIP